MTRTTPHLPTEVLAEIVRHVPGHDKKTLAALMTVSRAAYDLAGRRLYADLVLTDRTLRGVLLGLLPSEIDIGDVERDRGYPNATSDARKRALLALTTSLRVNSVDRTLAFPSCPLDKRTFPSARSIHVLTPVPHHQRLVSRHRARRVQRRGGGSVS